MSSFQIPRLDKSWEKYLSPEFEKPYMQQLILFLSEEQKKGKTIYPPSDHIFEAFNETPFNSLKVVILGQDPYHGKGQANGLCFSVNKGIRQPPSLQNIFKELHEDLKVPEPKHGDLSGWAQQGVLLLNAILTVRSSEASSHRDKGWETFTDQVIKIISENLVGIVFLLWGKFAHSKEALIDNYRHFILKAAHPSPYSASNGFFGCRHFSKTNEILKSTGKDPIDWSNLE